MVMLKSSDRFQILSLLGFVMILAPFPCSPHFWPDPFVYTHVTESRTRSVGPVKQRTRGECVSVTPSMGSRHTASRRAADDYLA